MRESEARAEFKLTANSKTIKTSLKCTTAPARLARRTRVGPRCRERVIEYSSLGLRPNARSWEHGADLVLSLSASRHSHPPVGIEPTCSLVGNASLPARAASFATPLVIAPRPSLGAATAGALLAAVDTVGPTPVPFVRPSAGHPTGATPSRPFPPAALAPNCCTSACHSHSRVLSLFRPIVGGGAGNSEVEVGWRGGKVNSVSQQSIAAGRTKSAFPTRTSALSTRPSGSSARDCRRATEGTRLSAATSISTSSALPTLITPSASRIVLPAS